MLIVQDHEDLSNTVFEPNTRPKYLMNHDSWWLKDKTLVTSNKNTKF